MLALSMQESVTAVTLSLTEVVLPPMVALDATWPALVMRKKLVVGRTV